MTTRTARAMWKGILHVGTLSVPVKLYSAVQEQGVHFRLLDTKQRKPVEQRMVNPANDEPVESGEVRKGYALDDGRFVILEPEELAELEPAPSRDVTLSRFVPLGSVPRPYYVRPYYLGPDGDSEGYFALARALEQEAREGIAHWVMRKHAYHGVLRAQDGYLTLITLRHAGEVILASELPRPTGRAPSQRELDMAQQLIDSYAGDAELASFKDEYRERVLELVEKKAEGKRVRLKKAPVKQEDSNLADALSRSLKQAKHARRVA